MQGSMRMMYTGDVDVAIPVAAGNLCKLANNKIIY